MPNDQGLYTQAEVDGIIRSQNLDAVIDRLKSDYATIASRIDQANHLKATMVTKSDLQGALRGITTQFEDLKAQVLTIDQFSLIQVRALQLVADRQLDHQLHLANADKWWERMGVKVAVAGGVLGAILLGLNTLVAFLAIKGH